MFNAKWRPNVELCRVSEWVMAVLKNDKHKDYVRYVRSSTFFSRLA
jgi:hypothetical protein